MSHARRLLIVSYGCLAVSVLLWLPAKHADPVAVLWWASALGFVVVGWIAFFLLLVPPWRFSLMAAAAVPVVLSISFYFWAQTWEWQ